MLNTPYCRFANRPWIKTLTIACILAFSSQLTLADSNQYELSPNAPTKCGELVITPTKIEFVNTLESDNMFVDPYTIEDPEGTICHIFYTVKNQGKSPSEVKPTGFRLKDAQGDEFAPPSSFEAYMHMKSIDDLSPGLSKKGSTFFEVPKGTSAVTVFYETSR